MSQTSRVRIGLALLLVLLCSTALFAAALNLYIVQDPETGLTEAVWANQPTGVNTADILSCGLTGSTRRRRLATSNA